MKFGKQETSMDTVNKNALEASKKLGFPVRVIANDDGYNQNNLAWLEWQDGVFVIKEDKIRSRGKRGKHSSTLSFDSVGLFSTGDEFYTIGDNLPDSEDTRSDEFSSSPLNRFLVHCALKKAGVVSGEQVAVVTGLPLKQYGNVSGPNMRLINAKRKNMLTPVTVGTNQSPSAEIIYHGCYSEAIGGLYDYLLEIKSDGTADYREGIEPEAIRMVLDIGGNTTDMAIIHPDNTVPYMDTIKYGVSHIRDKLKLLIENEEDAPMDNLVIDEALMERKAFVFGEMKDYSALWSSAVTSVLNDIFREVDVFKKQSPGLREIIVFGGGSALCEDVIREKYPMVKMVQNPDGANARGFLLAAMFFNNGDIIDQLKSVLNSKTKKTSDSALV